MTSLIFIGTVFESIIIVISLILLYLIFKRYRSKRSNLTLILLIIFINFVIALIFSWLSKVLRLFTGLDYLINETTPSPGTFFAEFLLRIVAFRFTFLFIAIGVGISYILRVQAFNEEYKKWEQILVICLGSFTGIYLVLVYSKDFLILDLIAFILIAIFTSFVYGPFTLHSLRLAKSVEDKTYRTAFYSLALMAISLIFVLIFQFIDRIFVILGSPGYTIFYFLGTSSILISILGAYLGYIRPGASEK